jgi:hypothetical protein
MRPRLLPQTLHMRRRVSLLMFFATLAAGPAAANLDGYPQCRAGEEVRMVVSSTLVPTYMPNAQRGDVVLTSGGHGLARVILDALEQDFHHTLVVSEALAANGHTLLTHETGSDIGDRSKIWVGQIPVGVQPDLLRRMAPGNVERDTAQTLLTGALAGCNDHHDLDTCVQLGARMTNLWYSTLLVRSNPNVVTGNSIAAAAEAPPQGAFPYALGSYSRYSDALLGIGDEAGFGPGTMCSGFGAYAVNAALAQQGRAAQLLQRAYSPAERVSAATALWDRFVSDNAGVLLFPELPSQVIRCFAFGGACNNPLPLLLTTTALGAGVSISGQDLYDQSSARLGQPDAWAQQVIPAQWAGGYTIDRFDHFECCVAGTNSCRRTDTATPIALDFPYRGLVGGNGPLPPGVTPDAIADTRTANALLAGLLQRPGFIDERDDAICYVADGASVCAPLPARTEFGPRAPRLRDVSELVANDGAQDPTLPLIEDTTEGEGLIADVALPDAVCAGDVFAVDVAAFSPATRVRINGHIGSTAVIAAAGPLPSPVVVYARDERGAEQLIARNVEVVDCGPIDTVLRLAAKRLPFAADAFRFSLDTLDPRGSSALVEPIVYAWDFGDGVTSTTATPTVRHDYARRVQRSDGDAFVVTVKATDAEGSSTTTQTSVHLKNTFAAAANASGVWTLRGEVQQQRPRFTGGAIVGDVEVSNIAPRGPFVAHTATVVMQPCDRQQKPTTTTWKAGAINAAFVVDSGASQTLRVKVPVPATLTTAVCRYDLTLQGTLEGKASAVVPVSIETGPFVGVGVTPARAAVVQRFTRLVARAGATADVLDALDVVDEAVVAR